MRLPFLPTMVLPFLRNLPAQWRPESSSMPAVSTEALSKAYVPFVNVSKPLSSVSTISAGMSSTSMLATWLSPISITGIEISSTNKPVYSTASPATTFPTTKLTASSKPANGLLTVMIHDLPVNTDLPGIDTAGSSPNLSNSTIELDLWNGYPGWNISKFQFKVRSDTVRKAQHTDFGSR